MIVSWPPKDKMYVEYSPQMLDYAHYIWDGPIKYYNSDDIYPDSKDQGAEEGENNR